MAVTFKGTVIKKARFVYSPFSAETMAGIADAVMKAVIARTKAGKDVTDNSAKALSENRYRYPERKVKAGLDAIRNWVSPRSFPRNRIKTLRAMKVKSANENRAVIGFIDPMADKIAHINNKRDKQFGISSNDRSEALIPAVNAAINELVKVKRGS